jgi:ppGpp synthetase/RelA/SpoT-type nucleotidyltranferase
VTAPFSLEIACVPWTTPGFSRKQVDAAGAALAEMWYRRKPVDANEFLRAWEIVNNWRSSHSFPLNTFQTTLRDKARKVYPNAIVAQRIKRTASIVQKVERYKTISLSRMQDIGGCRAIVGSVGNVFKLRDAYLHSQIRHKLVREKNYINEPKASGYRGVHLVYRYTSDRATAYNGLLIEMQLRSRLQHAWATAVETAGTFLERSLKSSQGPTEWLQFFALVSSAFAIMEGRPTVPGTPSSKGDLKKLIGEKAKMLGVDSNLRAFGAAAQFASESVPKESHYFLLELRPDRNVVTVSQFPIQKLDEANAAYAAVEQRIAGENIPGVQAVLVSVDKIETLRKAYPNFYLDTTAFLDYLKQVLG